METIADIIRDTWDNTIGRLLIVGGAIGWVPFYLLTEAHAALTN